MNSKKGIFADILASAQTNCVLKIKLRDVMNPVITAVDRVDKDKITLKPTCLYGFPVPKSVITLADIESVIRYKTYFNHPLFEKIRFIKNNIAAIRQNFEAFSQDASINPGARQTSAA